MESGAVRRKVVVRGPRGASLAGRPAGTSGEVQMAQWYYSKGGEQKGPVEQQELQRLLSTGEVQPGDLVWRDGLANWQPAQHVPELAATASAQPQQPGFQQPQPGYQQPGQQA